MRLKAQERKRAMDEKRQKVLRHIGERIKVCRREHGYSREFVAEHLKITPRTLAAYERGEREMSMETAICLARIYRTTLTKLTDYTTVSNTLL